MAMLALWLAVALGLVALGIVARGQAPRAARVALPVAMVAVPLAFGASRPHAFPPMKGAPTVAPEGGYVGSDACASCHPGEHASWTRTFHRTMTQRATRGSVLVPLDKPIDAEGERYTLRAGRDGAVWERTERGEEERVLLTTGSHHMQGYWVAAGAGALRMLPFVFARDDAKAIARRDAFVEPPDEPQQDVRWNSNCIACHATAGEPRAETDGYATRVAELGIACEACHGPGGTHVDRYHDPLARLAQRRARGADASIVNPARLPADRASALCGQCHSYAYPRDEDAFWRTGFVAAFRPGDTLDGARWLLSPDTLGDPRGPKLDTPVGDLFWSDGTVRVAGREYNAMVLSACYVRGDGARRLGCESCHAMHASDPDDMLRRDRSVEQTCGACHAMPAGHSHHAPGSPGDACVACHMPKTSYALRTAIRSHRIDSPSVRAGAGRPNACNLCHLDRSLAWTERALRTWRRASEAPAEGAAPEIPESVRGLLTRDAAERVLWADAMGDADAIAASGSDWEGALLRYAATHDPYAVVRYVATRSQQRLSAMPATARAPHVPLGDDDMGALARMRDDHPIVVAE